MSQASQTPVFFIDRCLGKHPIQEILREMGVRVEIHDDHFPQNTLDQDWLPIIGEWGWIILTKDSRIARNTVERQAVARANLQMWRCSGYEIEFCIHLETSVSQCLKNCIFRDSYCKSATPRNFAHIFMRLSSARTCSSGRLGRLFNV